MSKKSHLRVICHDHHHVVAANFIKISESGGELIADTHSGDPVFAIKSKIYLDIINESTGKSTVVHARLAQAIREKDHWVYLVRWNECPTLLRSELKSA